MLRTRLPALRVRLLATRRRRLGGRVPATRHRSAG